MENSICWFWWYILVWFIFCPRAGRAFLFCLPHKKETKKVTTAEKPGLILRSGNYPLASGQGLPVSWSFIQDRTIPMLQSGCKHPWTSQRTRQAFPICFIYRYFIISPLTCKDFHDDDYIFYVSRLSFTIKQKTGWCSRFTDSSGGVILSFGQKNKNSGTLYEIFFNHPIGKSFLGYLMLR